MTDYSTATARAFSDVMTRISPDVFRRQTKTRYLVDVADDLEKMVDSALLREAMAPVLKAQTFSDGAVFLYMDRRGGGKGTRTAASIIEMLGAHVSGASLIYVTFVTPPAGVGTLMRSALVRKGAACGVLVDVVATPFPAEGVVLDESHARDLVSGVDYVITYAPGGSAGFISIHDKSDMLVHVSDLCVLSFPDPEHVVADLGRYERVIDGRPGFNHVRFIVQTREEGAFVTLGHCLLGEGGDAHEQLWRLIDNAKRRVYRILAEPVARHAAVGTPLVYPCGSTLKRLGETVERFSEMRIVRAASDIVLVGRR